MAKTLTKSGITTGTTVEAFHVTQSVDAFTGTDAYNISLSGSFNMTGSINGQPGVTNDLTSSYAITASYAENAGSSTFGNKTTLTFSDGNVLNGHWAASRFYSIGASSIHVSTTQLSASQGMPSIISPISGTIVSASFAPYTTGTDSAGCGLLIYNLDTDTSASFLNGVGVFADGYNSYVPLTPTISVNPGDRLSLFLNAGTFSTTPTSSISSTILIIES